LSNWRSQQSLGEFLVEQNTVAIADVDTRRLTRLIREKGAMSGCIVAGEDANEQDAVAQALAQAQGFEGLAGADLAQEVTGAQRPWTQTPWELGTGFGELTESTYHVIAYDFGVKRNILRILAGKGCRLTVVPAQTSADAVLALNPDGIFLSNGPGDPEPCDYAIDAIKQLLGSALPMFGICLGHQLLALASGAKTMKMINGHHGANHPVQELADGTVMITSQNHGFAVDADSLPEHLVCTHQSLFDGTVQGVARIDVPAFGFQGHPEASPGPQDCEHLFDRFVEMMADRAEQSSGGKDA
jgi:carbamoyl-phosphate synthase small subunit